LVLLSFLPPFFCKNLNLLTITPLILSFFALEAYFLDCSTNFFIFSLYSSVRASPYPSSPGIAKYSLSGKVPPSSQMNNANLSQLIGYNGRCFPITNWNRASGYSISVSFLVSIYLDLSIGSSGDNVLSLAHLKNLLNLSLSRYSISK